LQLNPWKRNKELTELNEKYEKLLKLEREQHDSVNVKLLDAATKLKEEKPKYELLTVGQYNLNDPTVIQELSIVAKNKYYRFMLWKTKFDIGIDYSKSKALSTEEVHFLRGQASGVQKVIDQLLMYERQDEIQISRGDEG